MQVLHLKLDVVAKAKIEVCDSLLIGETSHMAGRKDNAQRKHRITLDFSLESQEFIERLRWRTNCTTKAELFRMALNILDFVVDALSRGQRFIVEDKNANRKEIVVPIMPYRTDHSDEP